MIEYQSMLREYYSRYLTEVRGLSLSSVKHYLDALNNISKRLQAKGLIKCSIYEISSLERLNYIRDVLFADSDFVAMNERGKRMYSAGLNNYCRFASGADFHETQSKMSALDVPVAAEKTIVRSRPFGSVRGFSERRRLRWRDMRVRLIRHMKHLLPKEVKSPI